MRTSTGTALVWGLFTIPMMLWLNTRFATGLTAYMLLYLLWMRARFDEEVLRR